MDPVKNILGKMSKFKVGDIFRIRGEDPKELFVVTIPKGKYNDQGQYGFEKLTNRAIHGDSDENLMIKVRK